MRTRRAGLLLACVVAVAGCSGDDGDGTGSVRFVVSDEGAAVKGYPLTKNGVEIRFVDGWTLSFERYLVVLGDISLRDSAGNTAAEDSRHWVVDLTQGDSVVTLLGDLPARRWDRLSFSVPWASAAAIPLGAVAAQDVEELVAAGGSYLISGSASHPSRGTVTFDWILDNPTRNRNCTNGLDNTSGVVVRNNATSQVELTVHVDHLFWDTLGAEQTNLRFDPFWGADKDKNGEVTRDELVAQRITNLTDPDGAPLLNDAGVPLVYNPASVPLADKTLWHFLLASTSSQIHYNGVGLCSISALVGDND